MAIDKSKPAKYIAQFSIDEKELNKYLQKNYKEKINKAHEDSYTYLL